MPDTPPEEALRLFVVLNPMSGQQMADEARRAFEQHFTTANHSYELYEITGDEHEQLAEIIHAARQRGCDIVVAAGGDGTVSSAANALVQTDTPLAIVPIGTANVLAQELGIPLDIDAACRMIVEHSATATIDAMQVGERFFFLQIGIGLDALVMRDTHPEAKRRFGLLAFIWNTLLRLVGYQPRRFTIVVDDQRIRPRAAQVMIANGGIFGVPMLRWGPDIYLNDGHVDLCIIYARSLLDYIVVFWHMLTRQHQLSHKVRYLSVSRRIIVHSDEPLPIQGDGEMLDQTPVQIKVIPHALQLVTSASNPPGIRSENHEEHQKWSKKPDQKEVVMTNKPDEMALNPGGHSVTPTPTRQPSPEQRAKAANEREALKAALRQIQTPEQAQKIVDAALAAAEDTSELQIREQEGISEDDVPQNVQQAQEAAASLGPEKTARVILEASREVARTSGESREALEQAFQEATNPEQQDIMDPSMQRPLALLRGELLKRMRPVQAIDARLFLAINHLPHPPFMNRLMYNITTVMNGGWGWVLGLMVAALIDKKRGGAALRQVVPPLWFATMSVEYPIKSYFRRRRPFIDIVQAISVGKKPGSYSFPSGHSAAAFAGAWLLHKQYPEQTPIWYTIATIVAFSRMYLGAHYPGDVLSGALTGTIIAEVTRQVMDQENGNGS